MLLIKAMVDKEMVQKAIINQTKKKGFKILKPQEVMKEEVTTKIMINLKLDAKIPLNNTFECRKETM